VSYAFALAVASLGLLASGQISAQELYNVTEITPPPGSNYIVGFAINASGRIAGELDNHAQAIASGGAVPQNLAFITAPDGGAVSLLPATESRSLRPVHRCLRRNR
jgi:hypothetical protein